VHGQAWLGNSELPFFLKAAELIAGPRARINAATMIAIQNVHQAEIDASCELIDFYVLM
jgi:hypothetical protein